MQRSLVWPSRFAPVLSLSLGLAAGAAVAAAAAHAPAPGGAALPEATGAERKSAEALFARYVDLEHAFDPALVELYANDAHIQSRIIVAGRPPTIRTFSGAQYKDLLRRALAKAKEKREDLNYYTAVTYLREGARVRIRAVRYAELQKAVSPMELLVGPDAHGTWRIFEELSESHPILRPPPPRT
ncbi:MAG TPA: hypothetical protein VKY89_14355 [Thermoanaerobaculia bacterium]|jgi:hypothetical protein|nr:hypothetical protein [Thermoanaerobaculia bacterium]